MTPMKTFCIITVGNLDFEEKKKKKKVEWCFIPLWYERLKVLWWCPYVALYWMLDDESLPVFNLTTENIMGSEAPVMFHHVNDP